jgi:hypothetical protein
VLPLLHHLRPGPAKYSGRRRAGVTHPCEVAGTGELLIGMHVPLNMVYASDVRHVQCSGSTFAADTQLWNQTAPAPGSCLLHINDSLPHYARP